jgi:hypothetical protein
VLLCSLPTEQRFVLSASFSGAALHPSLEHQTENSASSPEYHTKKQRAALCVSIMPPRKKRKRTNTSKEPPTSTTPATPPPVLIKDVKVFTFSDLRDNKNNVDKEHTGFRVQYRFVLNMKCCGGCKIINAMSMLLQLLEKEGGGAHQ